MAKEIHRFRKHAFNRMRIAFQKDANYQNPIMQQIGLMGMAQQATNMPIGQFKSKLFKSYFKSLRK